MEIQTQARAATALESPEVRRIVPTKRRIRLGDIFRESSVVRVMAARDFKVKYKQSLLGPLWLIFQPVALLAAFFIAFRGLANVQPGIPYIVFAMGGLMVWAFFQAALTFGTPSLIMNLILIKFTPVMRLAFPVAATIASLPTLAATVLGGLSVAAVTGTLSPRAVLLPVGFVWLFVLALAAILISSAITVRFRDLISVTPFLLQIGVFLAPIGYPLSSLSEPVRILIDFNPITGLIEAFRWALIADYRPSGLPIAISLGMTLVLAVLAWRLFSRMETTMADEI